MVAFSNQLDSSDVESDYYSQTPSADAVDGCDKGLPISNTAMLVRRMGIKWHPMPSAPIWSRSCKKPFGMSTYLTRNGALPAIQPCPAVNMTAEERSSAIDFINRNNFLFEEFVHDKMLSHFMPDSMVRHFHGTLNGIAAHRQFFEDTYGYLIPGVARHASNHIVDRDVETGGVIVRYREQLVREAWPADFEKTGERIAIENVSIGDLPQIWISNLMVDRLVKTADGWKIHERYLGPAAVNPKMHPSGAPKK